MNFSYLAELRKAFKLNKTQLAEKADLSVDTLSKWEKEGIPGQTHTPYVIRYSRALRCSIDVIFHFSDLQKEMNKAKDVIQHD